MGKETKKENRVQKILFRTQTERKMQLQFTESMVCLIPNKADYRIKEEASHTQYDPVHFSSPFCRMLWTLSTLWMNQNPLYQA